MLLSSQILYENEYVNKRFRNIVSEIVRLSYPELTTQDEVCTGKVKWEQDNTRLLNLGFKTILA